MEALDSFGALPKGLPRLAAALWSASERVSSTGFKQSDWPHCCHCAHNGLPGPRLARRLRSEPQPIVRRRVLEATIVGAKWYLGQGTAIDRPCQGHSGHTDAVLRPLPLGFCFGHCSSDALHRTLFFRSALTLSLGAGSTGSADCHNLYAIDPNKKRGPALS